MKVNARKVIALAVGALALAGCSTAIPEPKYDETAVQPAVTSAQLQAVLQDTANIINQAASAADPQILQARLAETALKTRTAQMKIAKAPNLELPSLDLSSAVTSDTKGKTFPRLLFNISEESDNSPRTASIFRQEDLFDNFHLHQWVRLFPGVTVPATPALEAGTQLVPENATGYLRSPRDTVNTYITYLTNPAGEAKAVIEAGPFSHYLQQTVSDLRQKLSGGKNAVKVELRVEPAQGPVTAFTAADESLLVFAPIRYDLTLTVALEGTTITPPPGAAQFLGSANTISGRLTMRHLASLLFRVPAQDSGETKIQVLGAETVMWNAESNTWAQLHP